MTSHNGDPIGPGSYDIEKSLEMTKPRHPSPDIGRTTDRQSQAREDSISPDQYDPKKEFVLNQSPSWTIGVRRPSQLQAEGDTDMGPGAYDANQSQHVPGPSFGKPRPEELRGGSSLKARPKSTLTHGGRARNSKNAPNKRNRFNDEIDSYKDPPKFGESARSMAFGPPRDGSKMKSQKTKKTSVTASQTHQVSKMSMMSQVVFEQVDGPSAEGEQMSV